jgi:HSP20 family molecular chaperone IbpA
MRTSRRDKLLSSSLAATAMRSVATAQPFLLGLEARDEEMNSNNIPRLFSGFQSPFLSSIFDDVERARPPLPDSTALSAFFDEASSARKRFFSSFFGDENESFPFNDGGKRFLQLGDASPRSLLRRGTKSAFPLLDVPHLRDQEVIDDHEKFQVSFQLPEGIESKDVEILVQNRGTRLLIQGRASVTVSEDNTEAGAAPEREETGHGSDKRYHRSTSIQFSQSYSLNPDVVKVNDFTAKVENGRLTVWAPKDERKALDGDQTVKIQNLDPARSSDDLAKSNSFDPSNPHILRAPPTPEQTKDAEDKIAAASARADNWKEASQMTL